MDNIEYEKKKNEIISNRFPFKVFDKSEIISKGHNRIDLNGIEIEINDKVQREIDRFMGLTSRQIESVTSTFGQDGIRDIRNFFALLDRQDNTNRIALVANAQTKEIIATKTIEKDPISIESFFEFIDMFMDRNSYYPEKIRIGCDGIFGINVTLKPHHKQYGGLDDGDEFLTNGLYFRWNLNEIEGGNYIERLICSNGQTQEIPYKKGIINDCQPESINRMLALPENKQVMRFNVERLYNCAAVARETFASLSEVMHAKQLLIDRGVDYSIAEEIAPCDLLVNKYENAGINIRKSKGINCKSDIRFWDLYNHLTHFATHTTLWEDDDIRRDDLMKESFSFLSRPRDIQRYISIFD